MDDIAPLSHEDKSTLLRLASRTLEYYLTHGEAPWLSTLGIRLAPSHQARRGAFVTLTLDARLRGCIGDIFPRRPLYQSVMGNAINAAVHDCRFPPLTLAEVPGLKIEISALGPPQSVVSYREIRLGQDGIILQKDQRRAVFLPQVAPEQGWGLEETLSHLSRKAGLAAETWRRGATLQVFQADVFGT